MPDAPQPDEANVFVDVADAAWRCGELANLEDDTIAAVLAALRGRAPEGPVEVSVRLTGDNEIRNLNRDWRGQDKATNVLAFALDTEEGAPGIPTPLGDVVVAFETCCREAQAENKPVADHLRHLLVHGTLHLLGFDHEDARDADRMESEERSILAGLGVPDPYADSEAA